MWFNIAIVILEENEHLIKKPKTKVQSEWSTYKGWTECFYEFCNKSSIQNPHVKDSKEHYLLSQNTTSKILG